MIRERQARINLGHVSGGSAGGLGDVIGRPERRDKSGLGAGIGERKGHSVGGLADVLGESRKVKPLIKVGQESMN